MWQLNKVGVLWLSLVGAARPSPQLTYASPHQRGLGEVLLEKQKNGTTTDGLALQKIYAKFRLGCEDVFERLEPCGSKDLCTVLRRLGAGNRAWLPGTSAACRRQYARTMRLLSETASYGLRHSLSMVCYNALPIDGRAGFASIQKIT